MRELNLSNNLIEDISSLRDLKRLEYLRLGDNPLKSITHLKELKNLRELGLWGTQISDISPLKYLTSLSYLNLTINKIEDISPLRNLKLRKLMLQSNPIEFLESWVTEFELEIEWAQLTNTDFQGITF